LIHRGGRIITRQILIITFLLSLTCFSVCRADDKKEVLLPWKAEVYTLAGRKTTLPHKDGKITIYVFQAFWCDTWKEVAEGHKALVKDMRDLPCDFAAVCIDSTMPDESVIKKFIKNAGYPVFFDRSGDLTGYYKIKAVPTFIIYDKNGRQVYRHEGYPGNKILKKLLIELNKPKNSLEEKIDKSDKKPIRPDKTKKTP
jgi:thioredoxin-related protein